MSSSFIKVIGSRSRSQGQKKLVIGITYQPVSGRVVCYYAVCLCRPFAGGSSSTEMQFV